MDYTEQKGFSFRLLVNMITNFVYFLFVLLNSPTTLDTPCAHTCLGRLSKSDNIKDKKTTTISPMVSVRNGTKAIDFYKRAFGAEQVFRVQAPSREVVSRLSVDGPEFWLADKSHRNSNFSPESIGGSTARMVLVVGNPDAAFERAILAGGNIIWPVSDQPYGWRAGRLLGPFGHHWEIEAACIK
jgi:PhnB protein